MSTQDLEQRLALTGLSKSEFAARLDVEKSAVSNWLKRGKWSDEAEALVASLETNQQSGSIGFEAASDAWYEGKPLPKPDTHIPVGNLVKTDSNETCIVVRRDRCESLNGSISWIYWICSAVEEKGLWKRTGVTTRIPEKFLTDLGQVQLKSFETEAQEKGK